MSLPLWQDPRLYRLLQLIDAHEAARIRALGCCHCGSRLHEGGFSRKPRGCPPQCATEAFCWRTSYDCSVCRHRTKPSSLRFLDRHGYLAVVRVLMNPEEKPSASWLSKKLAVSRRTVRRWQHWWREVFVQTPLWRQLCGQILPAPVKERLPASLLERMEGVDPLRRLVRCLKWLRPAPPTRVSARLSR
jgi:hypothetical protein